MVLRKKKTSTASPLSRIEQEAYRQKQTQTHNRVSLISAASTDSVSTAGRLLDKLKLADNEWDDSESSIISDSQLYDPDTSIISSNETSLSDIAEYNDRNNSKSISNVKFKYLKSVLGSTKKKQFQKSAVNKALELGKRINTVEQNASRVINRSEVKSIHLDDLIHDADSSILSLYDTDEDSDGDGDGDGDGDTDDNEWMLENQIETKKYNGLHHKNLKPISTPLQDEFSFMPQTPTRSLLETTPINSPLKNHGGQMTPSNSIGSTPTLKINRHQHNLSSLSNNSAYDDEIPNSFMNVKKPDDISFAPYYQHRQLGHSHTQSAAIHNMKTLKNTDLNDLNNPLNRSASVPIRKPSIKHSPVPNQILPPTPTSAQQSIDKQSTTPHNHLASMQHLQKKTIPNSPKDVNNNNQYKHRLYNTGNTNRDYPQQCVQGTPLHSSQSPQQQKQQYVFPLSYANSQQKPYNSPNSFSNSKRLMTSPNTPNIPNLQYSVPHQQAANHNTSSSNYRNYNQQYPTHGAYSRAPNQPNYLQSQPPVNPHLNQNYLSQPNNPYYNNTRYGYSSQNPQHMAYPKIGSPVTNQGNYMNHSPNYRHYESGSHNSPSLHSNFLKKDNTFQNVDLSYIIPR
jgi:hypothetical protein